MRLKKINIKNYRSIESLTIDLIDYPDNCYTYSLIGVNEAGKSSILKAIALHGDLPTQITKKDFKSKEKAVVVEYVYDLTYEDNAHLISTLPRIAELEDVDRWDTIIHQLRYEYTNPVEDEFILASSNDGDASISLTSTELPEKLHRCIYWAADEKHLINHPINLKEFATDPNNYSIPLRNCFLLAGIHNIQQYIEDIENESTEREYLQDLLCKAVNEHIRTAWPDHPITITFQISSGMIYFHVKDESTLKAKVVSQRSDGFKQFVSFLLTVSAQNKNSELKNTILLLDEPETHLHPQAQEYLLSELKKITSNSRNNVVIYATHSIFMIDKDQIDRNHKINKVGDTTTVERFHAEVSSYSSVIYEVFDIPSTDYHNELFGRLHQKFMDENPEDETREYLKVFDKQVLQEKIGLKPTHKYKDVDKSCTLPTYIRNCIHHSENGNKYTIAELRQSIEIMRHYLNA